MSNAHGLVSCLKARIEHARNSRLLSAAAAAYVLYATVRTTWNTPAQVVQFLTTGTVGRAVIPLIGRHTWLVQVAGVVAAVVCVAFAAIQIDPWGTFKKLVGHLNRAVTWRRGRTPIRAARGRKAMRAGRSQLAVGVTRVRQAAQRFRR